MAKRSAGILLYRGEGREREVLLVHPGGPFFRNKDRGSWSIPKGEVVEGEDELAAALRELREETGVAVEAAEVIDLGEVRQKGGKTVHAWAAEFHGSSAPALQSNLFEMEWPPRSGRKQLFPEVDGAAFFALPAAAEKINAAQREFLERLAET